MSSIVGLLLDAGDAAVGEEHDAVGERRRRRVVRDHDDRLAEVVDGAAHELEDLAAGGRVEVAGRLVAEDDGGPRDERARHGDALLLAAGHLGGPVVAAIAEPDRVDERLEPVAIGALAPMRSGSVMFSSAVRTGSRL